MQKINAISFGDSMLPVSVNTDGGTASDKNFQSVISNVKGASPAADAPPQKQASPAARISQAVKGKDTVAAKDAAAAKDTDYVNVSEAVSATGKIASAPDGTAVNGPVAVKELAAAEKAVAEAVQDVLGMNDEEFAAALADMGITVFDLLNPAVLQEFVMTLNPGSDVMDFLTDETMLQSLTDLSQSIEDIDWEALTGMSKEDFEAYLADAASVVKTAELTDNVQVQEVPEELRTAPAAAGRVQDFSESIPVQAEVRTEEAGTEAPEVQVVEDVPTAAVQTEAEPDRELYRYQQELSGERAVVSEGAAVLSENRAADVQELPEAVAYQEEAAFEELPEEPVREMPENPISFHEAEEAVQNTGGADGQPVRAAEAFRQVSEAAVQPVEDEAVQKTADIASAQTGSSGQQTLSWSSEEQVFIREDQVRPENVTTVMDFVDNMMQAVSGNQTLEQPVDMQQMIDIVNQVVERIHSTMEEGATRLEMQLNPESLGRLLLTVTNKNGVMTANFTVQTAEAKAAIESQMITLRESLEQKNLKVEAVEVEVSDFAFSQSGQADTGDQKEFSRGDGRRSRFQFDEDEEQEAEEDVSISDAERVRRQVMRDNGSSIDFTA